MQAIAPRAPERTRLLLPTLGAVVLALLSLAAIGVSAYAGWELIQASTAASEYRTAPLCAPDMTSGCREQVSTIVLSTRSTGGRSPTYLVSVRLADGRQLELTRFDDNGLYARLRPGQPLLAELWHGSVVLLRDGNFAMATRDIPDRQASDAFAVSVASLEMGLLLAGLAAAAWECRWAVIRACSTPNIAGSYKLPCTLRLSRAQLSLGGLLFGGLLLALCLVVLDPFQHPVSSFDPARSVGIAPLVLLVAPVLFLMARPRVTIQHDGLIIRSAFRTTGVLFQDITRIAALHQGQAFVLNIFRQTSDKPIRVPLTVLDRRQRAILIDAILTHTSDVHVDNRSRDLLAGI